MQVDELVKEFAQRLGLDAADAKEDDAWEFVFDDSLPLRISLPGGKRILLSASLAEEPDDDSVADWYHKLLSLNYLRLSEQRSVLTLDREAKQLLLCRTLPADSIDVDQFSDAVGEFLNSLEFWQVNLSVSAAPAVASPFNMLRP